MWLLLVNWRIYSCPLIIEIHPATTLAEFLFLKFLMVEIRIWSIFWMKILHINFVWVGEPNTSYNLI